MHTKKGCFLGDIKLFLSDYPISFSPPCFARFVYQNGLLMPRLPNATKSLLASPRPAPRDDILLA